MFTDLVGYSSMTSLDERRALRLLEEHRGLLQGAFDGHGGRVIKTMGDGFLVEFPSAVEAVECALQAQKDVRRFNENQGPGDKISIRIGVHVGDVVHSEGDILGDAVNVASRLQPLAEPDGICVTRQVVDQVERKVDCKFVKMGTRELKNIRYPVEIYRVERKGERLQPDGPGLDPRRVAILPLANLSADPNDRYFVEGMTEELISTVSRISELSVISRTSVMRYKDTVVPIGEIGRELSAGTVLEGSVRKAGNKVRITTQLIDSQNDKHIWAQSYDRDLTDIFAIQADIAEQVAQALRVNLLSKERKAVEKHATGDLEAYTLYLKGRYFWNERSFEGVAKAARYFEEAIKRDPSFALAYSGLADCYFIQEDRGWLSHSEAAVGKGYAEKAVGLDDELAEAHASLALALHIQWDMRGAEMELKRALELKPNYATAQHWYWILLNSLGRFEAAFEHEQRALQLDPHSSTIKQGIGIGLFFQGRYREALDRFERLAEEDPNFASAHFWNAWALERVGELDQAIAAMTKAAEKGGTAYPYPRMALAHLYAIVGKKEQAIKLVEEIQSEKSGLYKSPTLLAEVKLELGEEDEAYRLLERAYLEHDRALGYFRQLPRLAKYRSDPRWLKIERKMGY
jgi:TolB-like protein/Tfp pilus assembly protein PilF